MPRRRPRPASPLVVLAALALALAQGCGGEQPVFDKEAGHTPESLAEEFLFRYKALPARSSAREKARAAATEKSLSALPDPDAQTKSARSEAATKAASAPTLDALIAETEARVDRLGGTSRADAGKRVADLIGQDKAVTPDDLAQIRARLAP